MAHASPPSAIRILLRSDREIAVRHDAGGAMLVTVPRTDDFEVVAIGEVPA